MATIATLLPNAKQQFISANGTPLAGGHVFFYVPETSTLKATWQDAGQTILNANPITLDAAGEAIIYGNGNYRQVVYDADNNLIWDALTASTGQGGGDVTVSQPWVDVRDYGAVSDARHAFDAVTTSGSHTLTSATANFTVADTGKTIKVYDIANNAYVFYGLINSVTNSTTIILSGNASASMSSGNGIAYWGTDNAVAINAALLAASELVSQTYGQVNSPSGDGYSTVIFPITPDIGAGYLFTDTLVSYRNVCWNADAMLYNACGGTAADRKYAITCAGGIQINRIIMECGGGMGIQNGSYLEQSSSYIWQLQLWNVGTNYNAALSPQSQIAMQLSGNDYNISGFWCKGGNIGILLSNVSDMRMVLPEIIGCATGIQMAGCENVKILGLVLDTLSFAGVTIDGCHNITLDGNAFSVNATGLTYNIALGLFDSTNLNRNIKIDMNMQRSGGVGVHAAYTQDSTFNLLGSNSANYSVAGVALTYMVEYGAGNAGMITVNSTRDNTTSPAITNFTGTRYGVFYDNYMNSTTPTLHLYGTFVNP